MKALVLGAGIVGVTTAYELLRDGFEVTVIDREPEAANFTSYANAGLFAPGHSYAWGSPAAPGILLKSLWRNDVPAIGGVDEENLVAYCPLGERMRITATAEFSGYDRTHTPKDFRHMMKMARNLFPDAADYDQPEYWAGLRPMTPQGTPILGRGRHDNLWYNTGQGHMGWTMCHGAARITADLIGGRKPAISLNGMQVSG